MKDPYFIEVDKKGCTCCGSGTYWTVVGPDGSAIGSAWADIEFTQDIADLMNMAYAAGIEQSDSSGNPLTGE